VDRVLAALIIHRQATTDTHPAVVHRQSTESRSTDHHQIITSHHQTISLHLVANHMRGLMHEIHMLRLQKVHLAVLLLDWLLHRADLLRQAVHILATTGIVGITAEMRADHLKQDIIATPPLILTAVRLHLSMDMRLPQSTITLHPAVLMTATAHIKFYSGWRKYLVLLRSVLA